MHTVHNEKKTLKTRSFFFFSKPILCRWNKELAVRAARRDSVLCGSHNKRMCVCEKKGRRKREGGREKERDLKPTQYFIFERRCHDGNRYLKIEKHDSTSHFELKRAGGRWEKRRGGEERRGERSSKSGEESKEDGFRSGSS